MAISLGILTQHFQVQTHIFSMIISHPMPSPISRWKQHPEVLTVAIAIDVSLRHRRLRRRAIFSWDLLGVPRGVLGIKGGILESWKIVFTCFHLWIFFSVFFRWFPCFILIYIDLYWFILIYVDLYWFTLIYIDLYNIRNKHPNQPWLGVVDWVLKCPKNHFGGINQGLESCFCILRRETSKSSVHKRNDDRTGSSVFLLLFHPFRRNPETPVVQSSSEALASAASAASAAFLFFFFNLFFWPQKISETSHSFVHRGRPKDRPSLLSRWFLRLRKFRESHVFTSQCLVPKLFNQQKTINNLMCCRARAATMSSGRNL